MLFPELSFLDRIAAAADAGFEAVEFPFPYEEQAAKIARRCEAASVQVVLFNLPPGDLAAGDRGLACDPARRAEFRQSLAKAAHYAETLGCSQLNCLAGISPSTQLAPQFWAQEELERVLVENLQFAADAMADKGLCLLIEPINTQDMPGFFLNRSSQALRVMDAVNRPNLRLQYDIYHMQIMEGAVAETIETHIERIGHFQIADAPGRHEPGTGKINFTRIFSVIERLPYSGWIGCEYHPVGDTHFGLSWMDKFC